MSFNQLTAFTKKVADFADQVTGNPADIKAQFDAAPEELRTYFNNLIDALKSTASGDSGAKNTGATAITGLTGTDVQTILEALNEHKVSKDGGDTVNGDLTIGGHLKTGGAGHDIIFDAGRTNTTNIYWNASPAADFGLGFKVDGFNAMTLWSNSVLQSGQSDMIISGNGTGNVALRNGGLGTYVHNINGTAFAPINASAFNVNSDETMKKDITPFTENAEDLVNSTTVYQYHYKDELESEPKHTGLIMQEAPLEVNSINGVGVDVYAMCGVMWKAIQELSAKNTALEARVSALESQKG